MENGKQWFHNDYDGLHLLFEPLLLNENSEFITAYLLIVMICGLERGITYWLDFGLNKSNVSTIQRITQVIIRTIMYGIVTTLRLLYMLVVMYFNTGLFIIVICSLTLSQLVVEVLKSSHHNKTGPLQKKLQHKGYSDLSIIAEANGLHEDDEEEEYESQTKEYSIPKIVISGEI